MCSCLNGQFSCTGLNCEETEVSDKSTCQECMSEPINQVCGINGVTYRSACAAVFCGGLAPFDFFRGACPSVVRYIILLQ